MFQANKGLLLIATVVALLGCEQGAHAGSNALSADSDASIGGTCPASSSEIYGVVADPVHPCDRGALIVVGCASLDLHAAAVGCYTQGSSTVTTSFLYPELLEQGWTECSSETVAAVIGVDCQ